MTHTVVINEIKSIYGKVLGEILETSNSFGFCHVPTNHEENGFSSRSEAEDAFQIYHDDWFESLPRNFRGY